MEGNGLWVESCDDLKDKCPVSMSHCGLGQGGRYGSTLKNEIEGAFEILLPGICSH